MCLVKWCAVDGYREWCVYAVYVYAACGTKDGPGGPGIEAPHSTSYIACWIFILARSFFLGSILRKEAAILAPKWPSSSSSLLLKISFMITLSRSITSDEEVFLFCLDQTCNRNKNYNLIIIVIRIHLNVTSLFTSWFVVLSYPASQNLIVGSLL